MPNRFQLVGHSLGGSVIVRACPLLQERKFRITGVTVLDVVEGMAYSLYASFDTLLMKYYNRIHTRGSPYDAQPS